MVSDKWKVFFIIKYFKKDKILKSGSSNSRLVNINLEHNFFAERPLSTVNGDHSFHSNDNSLMIVFNNLLLLFLIVEFRRNRRRSGLYTHELS
jgi:hypothetical protein